MTVSSHAAVVGTLTFPLLTSVGKRSVLGLLVTHRWLMLALRCLPGGALSVSANNVVTNVNFPLLKTLGGQTAVRLPRGSEPARFGAGTSSIDSHTLLVAIDFPSLTSAAALSFSVSSCSIATRSLPRGLCCQALRVAMS